MNRIITVIFLFFAWNQTNGQDFIDRIEPPHWWTGMADTTLQLMVHGRGIAESNVIIDHKGIKVAGVRRVENPDYLFIDLLISRNTRPGNVKMVFEYQREILYKTDYLLKSREEGSALRKGFGKEDVIYLLMPDRFSNGNPGNDTVPGMLEPADRGSLNGRHGGDIEGIIRLAGHISDLGATAVWINPLLENNQPKYSYHGYAITDFYRIDPRFGSNEDYLELVATFHKTGLKVIMDMVFNHCGSNHWWMHDMPMADWVHQFPEYTRSNFRIETAIDPYASDNDRDLMQTGWFDRNMPDLNQHNPALATYLIQNSVWWIEDSGIDGIRMDTYPYSYPDFMAKWMERIRKEYPGFTVVGETWLQKEAHTAYWQDGSPVSGSYQSYLPSTTDFPFHYALKDAFTQEEGWSTGLARIYYVLAQDFMYADPFMNVIFADNHDLTRFYTSVGEDDDKFRMAMAVLLTTRGIPMIYYGTEYLMTGEEQKGHGYIREDFPDGEWGPVVSSQQEEAHRYLSRLLKWRKGNEAVLSGKLKQFVPKDGIYVYFRYTPEDAVMVMVNRNVEHKDIDLQRFSEVLKDYSSGRDVISQGVYELKNMIRIPAETTLVLELN